MNDIPPYEVYRELWRVTQWKDGAVYRTESLGCKWIDPSEEAENVPTETNIIYSAVPLSYEGMTIRRKK